MIARFTWLDWLGLSWFLICWIGYERIVDHMRMARAHHFVLEETHLVCALGGRDRC